MQSQDTNDLRKIADIINTKLSENDIAAFHIDVLC
jgi:hypothetical protein